jgi:hypothetical protein
MCRLIRRLGNRSCSRPVLYERVDGVGQGGGGRRALSEKPHVYLNELSELGMKQEVMCGRQVGRRTSFICFQLP